MRQPELMPSWVRCWTRTQAFPTSSFPSADPQVETFGVLKEAVISQPAIRKLTRFQTETMALTIVGNQRHLFRELVTQGACDCSYALQDRARFRVNIFRQRSNFAIIMRKAQNEMPSINSLGLPPIFRDMAKEKNGLILVTGATGSGKTTTLSAILNEINEHRAVHVVTLEDPIEYLHQHKKATFNQRELGTDFDNFPTACAPRCARRQRSFWWVKCATGRPWKSP